ncbi:MAG: hypothetical protein MJ210_03655, partial [Alphaproteobacteria bacterium]|nr:hypothetical protein [Alphaproteobacteria bacterium]
MKLKKHLNYKVIDMNIEQNLLNLARQAAKNAYAPYSKFCVGAAILGKNGNYYY